MCTDLSAHCDLVLPARNEAAALRWLLPRVPTSLGVIVVDNGSTDRTADVARELGATVVTEPRPGYGAAVHAGLLASRAELVAVTDADGSTDPADLVPLLALVAGGTADLALGRRRPTTGAALPRHARAGNAALLWWLRHRTTLRLHDIPPVRVCRRGALLELGVRDRQFGYPVELLVRAERAGWTVREVDVAYRSRLAGRSKVSGSLLGSVRAAVDLLRALP